MPRTTDDSSSPHQTAPGISLEKAVVRIQQMLDPQSTVSHNENLTDRVGNRRQFDVVIRGSFAGRSLLGVVECKDHSRRKGPDAIEAFAKKCENVGANLRLMVSRRGFTPQALNLAKHEGISCLSLLPGDSDNVGFSIGDYWYGLISIWTNLRIGIRPLPREDFLKGVDAGAIRFESKPVINWFFRELVTKHQDEKENEEYTLTVSFDNSHTIDCAGTQVNVDEIYCIAKREFVRKRRWINWTGDALYDWHAGSFTIPNKGILKSSVIESDLSSWPDYNGLLPNETNEPNQINIIAVTLLKQQHWNEADNDLVPNLKK